MLETNEVFNNDKMTIYLALNISHECEWAKLRVGLTPLLCCDYVT